MLKNILFMLPPFPVPSQEGGTFHGWPFKCIWLGKQTAGSLLGTFQGEEVGNFISKSARWWKVLFPLTCFVFCSKVSFISPLLQRGDLKDQTYIPSTSQIQDIGQSLLSGDGKCPSPGRIQQLHSEVCWWLKPGRALSWCPAKVRKFNNEQLKMPLYIICTHSSCGCSSNKNYTE